VGIPPHRTPIAARAQCGAHQFAALGNRIRRPQIPASRASIHQRSSSVIFGGSLLAMTGLVLRRKASSTNS
jgi:hypothetical protein